MVFKYVALGLLPCIPIFVLCRPQPYTKLFRNCGLINKDEKVPLLHDKKKKPYGYEITFHLPEGITAGDFEKHREALETFLDARLTILSSSNKMVIVKAFKQKLGMLYKFEKHEYKTLMFPLGYDHESRLVTVTLDDESPHMLIGGTSGSGKSVCLRTIITNLILTKKPENIKLHLCDLKGGVEFSVFRHSSFVASFAKNMMEAAALLNSLKIEMYRRLDLFEKVRAVNLSDYQKRTGVKLSEHVLFIDELANITLVDGNITEIINELLRMARCVGIHLILATQRPDKEVLPGSLKANITITVCFKTRNKVNSMILLDHDGAEELRGRGHGILQVGDEVEFQGLFLNTKEAEDLIKHTYVERREMSENVSGVIKRDTHRAR